MRKYGAYVCLSYIQHLTYFLPKIWRLTEILLSALVILWKGAKFDYNKSVMNSWPWTIQLIKKEFPVFWTMAISYGMNVNDSSKCNLYHKTDSGSDQFYQFYQFFCFWECSDFILIMFNPLKCRIAHPNLAHFMCSC